jgi:hypothetical protein
VKVHRQFNEQFLESQPGSGASFSVTGGFLNVATRSLKRVTGRIIKISNCFKRSKKTWHLIILAIKTKKLKTTITYMEITDLTV